MHSDTRREINDFFTNNPSSSKYLDTNYFTRLNPNCEFSKAITPKEILNTIRSFSNKAPGEDQICKPHLQHLPMTVIINLAHLYTASLCCGYFPENMKAAILTFIGKPGKSNFNPSNHRPISLLSMVGKIYGKILTARLTKFLEDKGIEHENQYGFRSGRSTTSCIAMNYEFISRHRTTHEHYKFQ